MIDEMMGEISREMFLGAAVAHVTDSAESGGSPGEVVSAVVGRHLEQLDSSFLSTLDAYIQGAGDRGAADVAEVLLLVRDEVLQRLGQRLPPEMQLLEAALSAGGSKERLALLQRYAALGPETLPARPEPAAAQQAQAEGDDMPSSNSSGGAADGPWLHCLAADLERAASQVVEDMELMLEVPDRRLLAKMVLLREEVQQMLVEAAFLGSGGALSPEHAALELPFRQLGAVPRSCAVFLQRLMTLSSPSERRALLEHAFQADREGEPAGAGDRATNFEQLRAEVERPRDWVRPGRFMQSLNALQQEMLIGSEAGGARADDAVLERLENIRREALAVLIDMAGEGQPYLP